MSGESGKGPVQVVLALYAAIRDRHIEDMLAVSDPEVVCFPLVRPGDLVPRAQRHDQAGRLHA